MLRLTEGMGLIGFGLGLTGGASLVFAGDDCKLDRGLVGRSCTMSGGVGWLANVVFRRLMCSWLKAELLGVGLEL